MEREHFKSRPVRGLPIGMISGFMCGTVLLLVLLPFGPDEDIFLPMIAALVVSGGIIGMLSSTGKSVEADKHGIYYKKREYLFLEYDMYMRVYTHFYNIPVPVPVTDRYIFLSGKDGKKKINCSYLSRQDAGRLMRCIEEGMMSKRLSAFGLESCDTGKAQVSSFVVPSGAAETIDKRIRLLMRIMFCFFTAFYSMIIISSAIHGDLEDQWLIILLSLALPTLILAGVNFGICKKFRNATRNIPSQIVFSGGNMYIDGKPFGGADVRNVVMTPERGVGTGDFRKLIIYENSGKIGEYCFGFRWDNKGYPGYGQLVEAVKDCFSDKFGYDSE